MHRNYFDHDKSELEYQRYISNIAYRFKFNVIYEEEQVLKEENGTTIVIVDIKEVPRNTLCWKAWCKLSEEYGYGGSMK
jgi:hypothetical protein